MQSIFLDAQTTLLRALPVCLARRIAQSGKPAPPPRQDGEARQLLVDVSVILCDDARTGIQRVVRALLQQLLLHPPSGFRVCPVFATRRHGYRYAPVAIDSGMFLTAPKDDACAVTAGPGDIFLGLDLAAHLLPRHQGDLLRWKRCGATLHVVVYDLIPVLHPEWFYPKTSRNFRRWLRAIAILADGVICISASVKAELTDWLAIRYGLSPGVMPVHTISLGADIEASVPSGGMPEDIDRQRERLDGRPSVLMVGTLEPRKGHRQVLAAFELLWRRGHDINLVIIGQPGWKTEALQQQLRARLQTQARLHWLDDASDEMLTVFYAIACGVVVASEAEGFGLPLIEATHHHKPVLARDIPVFREIAGDNATFFSGSSAESLAAALESWLAAIQHGPTPGGGRPMPRWEDSAQQLLRSLGFASSGSAPFLEKPAVAASLQEAMT